MLSEILLSLEAETTKEIIRGKMKPFENYKPEPREQEYKEFYELIEIVRGKYKK